MQLTIVVKHSSLFPSFITDLMYACESNRELRKGRNLESSLILRREDVAGSGDVDISKVKTTSESTAAVVRTIVPTPDLLY